MIIAVNFPNGLVSTNETIINAFQFSELRKALEEGADTEVTQPRISLEILKQCS